MQITLSVFLKAAMVLGLLFALSANTFALSYTISFTGSGASTSVDSVRVSNLTKSTSVKVLADCVLNLTDGSASANYTAADKQGITVSRNDANGLFTVSLYTPQAGVTQLSVYAADGRKAAELNTNLQTGVYSFALTLPQGVFVIQVKGNGFTCSAKVENTSYANSQANIQFTGNVQRTTTTLQKSKSVVAITTMTYAVGDQLLYKAYSGKYCTIVTDVPTTTQTTSFGFVACTDACGNNYAVVNIGGQTWMAENLKTTKYCDNTVIPNVTDNTTWSRLKTGAYCDYNNISANSSKYGKLYNWYAATDSRNIAPVGWHVPSDAEWAVLETYVATHLGASPNVAKSLATTADWASSSVVNSIGNDLTKNNSCGFGALSGGYRDEYGGDFFYLGDNSVLWSATTDASGLAWLRYLSYNGTSLNRGSNFKENGLSVRCVKD